MLKLQSNGTPVPIDVELREGCVGLLFSGDSGTGKTFLFSMLRSYCLVKGISCNLVDSTNYTMIAEIYPCDLLLLDNLDLYCEPEFLQKCLKGSKYVLCSIKSYPTLSDIPWVVCGARFSDKLLKVRMPSFHTE